MDTFTLAHTLRRLIKKCDAGEELSGTELAQVLTQISERELREGGPYAELGSVAPDPGLNLLIARFLQTQGVRLPNLDGYLATLTAPVIDSLFLSAEELEEELRSFRLATEIAQTKVPAAEISYTADEAAVMEEVRAALAARTKGTSQEISAGAQQLIERTIRGNPDKQMSLMPLYLRQALGQRGREFDTAHLGALGFANACFWSSFIVYDDFWDDDEAADPRLLPVANFLARHYIRYFERVLPEETRFPVFFHQAMDRLDAANAWETSNCRMQAEGTSRILPETIPEYGNYDIKYHPAAGHVMGSVAMLVQLGYEIGSPEIEALTDYFRHYLIAMQINDDAHDWREDLERGHISTAVAALLSEWKKRYPAQGAIDLAKDLPELEQLFWSVTLEHLCVAILDRCAQARQAVSKLSFLEDPQPLERFISRNEDAAHLALTEQQRGKDFLSAI